MPIQTTDFPKLTDDLESIFVENAKMKIADSIGMKLFGVTDDVRKTYEHAILHGTSGIKKIGECADLPTATSKEGDSIIYTQSRFGGLASVTKDMRKFDLHNKIESEVKNLTDDAFDSIDQSMSDVLLNGWATTYTDVYGATVTAVWPDGLALFSAAHTNGSTDTTYSNIMNDGSNSNPVLSRAAVVAERAAGRKYTDPNGIHRPIKLDTLYVWPDLEDLALRIVESSNMQGNDFNDTNGNLKSINVVVWDRLGSSSAGTDTSAYWFMADSRQVDESLKAIFAQRPMLESPEVVYKNKNWDYSLDFYYTLGRGFAPYIRGSKGDNS